MSLPAGFRRSVRRCTAAGRGTLRRLVWAWRLTRSGVVDSVFYRAQARRVVGPRVAAAWHYLSTGAESGLSLNPLFEPEFLAIKAGSGGDIDLLVDYLTVPALRAARSPHPAFDLRAGRRQLAERGIPAGAGAWLAWVRSARPDTPVPVPPGMEAITWQEFRDAAIKAMRDFDPDAEPPAGPAAHLSAGGDELVSIVAPLPATLAATLKRHPRLAKPGTAEGGQLVLVGNPDRAQARCLAVLGLVSPLRLVPSRRGEGLAELWNRGVAASSGGVLVLASRAARWQADALPPLVAALGSPGVAVTQPLNERADMTIQSAGALFVPGEAVPSPMLSQLPTEDAMRVGRAQLPAGFSDLIAVRRATVAGLQGFEPGFDGSLAVVDFSLRAAAAGLGATLLVPESRVVVRGGGETWTSAAVELLRSRWLQPPGGSPELLAAAGFRVRDLRPVDRTLADGRPVTVTEPVLARLKAGLDALPSLRWTIDTAATAGRWAQAWGDWHFASSLAGALRRLGQQVAVDSRQARGRATRQLDDVVLTLRGLSRVEPTPGAVNLLWVISHPDRVTADEVAAYDATFAASVTWPAERNAAWGTRIETLLQCTDVTRFHLGLATAGPGRHAVFVGNARRPGSRPVVAAALEAGIDLRIYGTGWDHAPAADRLVARTIPNDEVARVYAEAGVVLNDHWADMRAAGFFSNRLFDAVACGARVLSDAVPGAADLFGGSVQFADDPARTIELLTQPFEQNWPDEAARSAVAAEVSAEHSFDRRAQVLLERAIAVLQARSAG